MTHRQYVVWETWMGMEWSRPSRSDHYAMNIAYHVCRANAKDPNRVQLDHMRLRFLPPKSDKVPETREEAAEQSKQGWFSMLGIDPARKSRESSGGSTWDEAEELGKAPTPGNGRTMHS